MTTKTPEREVPERRKSVIQWLLDSDPSIRWQVMRDLMDESHEVVAGERSRVAFEGWGGLPKLSSETERRRIPRLKFFVTDSVEKFRRLGAPSLGSPIEDVEHVELKE